jgi:alpha-tubulin suppressor-like RCC1 family protein
MHQHHGKTQTARVVAAVAAVLSAAVLGVLAAPASVAAPIADPAAAPAAVAGEAAVANGSPGPVQTTLIPGSELDNPSGVAVDASGAVYVVDTGHARVLKVPKGGAPVVLPFSALSYPSSVAVDRAGNVYVMDSQIQELRTDGTQSERTMYVQYPGGLAVDSAANLYVSLMEAGQVSMLSPAGAQTPVPFSGLITPTGLAVDAADNIYVGEATGGKVYELAKGGGWGSQTQRNYDGNEPVALAVDHGGNVFVTQWGSAAVVVLPKGGAQSTLGFTGLSQPRGVGVDASGNVFVADPSAGLVELSSAAAAPGTPTAVSGNGEASVSWSAPAWNGGSPVTGYLVTPLVAGVPQTPTMFRSTATTQTVTGLVDGVSHAFTVAATTALGVGAPSAPSIPMMCGAPANPAFVSAAPGNGQAAVGWYESRENASPITGYVVTPFVGGVAQPSQTLSPTAARVVTGLTNGTSYTFRVAAVNALGTGAASGPSEPIVVGAPGMPGFASAVLGGSQATVSWWPPPGNGAPITGSVVTPYIGSTPQPEQVFSTGANHVTLTGLIPGAAYTFRVQAVNAFGRGRAGSTAPPPVAIAPPPSPAFLTPAPAEGAVTLSWWPVSGDRAPLTASTVTPYVNGVPQPARTVTGPANRHTVTGLTNGNTYTFRVALTNAVGTGPPATSAAVMVGAPPDAPRSPGVQVSSGAAALSWQAPPDNGLPITGYLVTPWAGAPSAPQRFDSTATSQTITGLTNGTSYFFVVQAITAAGAGPGMVTPTVVVGIVPGPAHFPTAVAGDSSATVSWWAANGNGSPVLGYMVVPYVGTIAQAPRTFSSTATSQIVTGLTNGTSYSFRVAAFNAVGTGPYGSTAVVTPAAVPSAPSTPVVQAGSSSLVVSWIAPADNGSPITGSVVTVHRGAVLEKTQVFANAATTQTVTGLADGTSYTVRVAATNAVGTGAPSPASLPVVAGSPSAPGPPSATAGSASATLAWTAADGHGYPITGYIVTPAIAGSPQPATTFASSATTQTVTGLTNGVTYTFTVVARSSCPGACATGPASTASNPVTPPGVLPTAPGSPTAVPGGAQATVSWTAADGHGAPIIGYVVTPYIGTTAQSPRSFASSATTQTITGLANGTTYTFRVAATTAVGTGPTASTPAVLIGRPARAITSGEWFSCALLGDGTVQCWGANNAGQLADGTTVDRSVPAAVPGLTGVTAITSGWSHECALLSDQTVRCWGWNPYGQLGNGTINNVNTAPVTVTGLTGVTAIAAGFGHTCALRNDGTVACWGWNGSGQLGDGTTTDKITPVVVPGLSGVTAIATGASHSCALLATGGERCWGRNVYGQLGDGTSINRSSPVTVPGVSGVTAITAGWEHSCSVLATGVAMCWGNSASGSLPAAVPGLTGVVGIAAGHHTCARLGNGTVDCWGNNGSGELGDGTTVSRTTPAPVVGLSGVTTIAVGLHTSCALTGAGTDWCWGRNNKGQVGDGSVVNRTAPVVVHGF